MQEQPNHGAWSFAEKLNLLIALCAVLISAASFYATFLQADAAEKQVRATTWPMLEYGHGNASDVDFEPWIYMTVTNGGVGPAHIQHFEYQWQGKTYGSIQAIIRDCCQSAISEVEQRILAQEENEGNLVTGGITDSPRGRVLSPGNKVYMYQLPKNDITQPIWDALNDVRWELEASACYCSVLEDCYVTNFTDPPVEVNQCPSR